MMCLQDLQLARLVQYRMHDLTAVLGNDALNLKYDKARVGILLSSPDTGNAELRVEAFPSVSTYVIRSDANQERLALVTVHDVGRLIFEAWSVRASTTMDLTVVEFFLPFDTDSLDEKLRTLK